MARQLGPLPREVYAPAGPVPVRRPEGDLKADDGDACSGLWCPDEREILIERGLSHETAWLTLYHEQVHGWLSDAGLLQADEHDEVLELVCQQVAVCLMNEHRRRGGH